MIFPFLRHVRFIIISIFFKYLTPALANGLRDNKSPQVSSTLLSILADLNNAANWMISTRPLPSNPSSPCTNLDVTNGIIVTFIFYSFFLFPCKINHVMAHGDEEVGMNPLR